MKIEAYVDPKDVAAQEKKARDGEIIKEVMTKRETYPQAWSECYKECQAHEKFTLMGEQMSYQTARQFGFGSNAKQPNLLKAYINNQANQTLQNNYRAVVTPNGGGSNVTKAREREQVLRGIQRTGGAAQVYNQARRYQLAAGIHYSRIVVDYAGDRGFASEYKYEDVVDTYNTFPDPNVQNCTFADMRDFLTKEDVPKALWKERTGQDWKHGQASSKTLWYYWRKKTSAQEKEYMTRDGKGVLESEIMTGDGEDAKPDFSNVKMMVDGVTPFSRDVSVYEWEWFMVNDTAKEILQEGTWKGCYAPLLACTGEKVVEQTSNGQKVHYYPLTRDAEEPQLVYTVIENIILLRLARSPYSKWKIAFESIVMDQIKQYRETAVIGELDVLYKSWNPDTKQEIPPPQEIEPTVLDRVLIELQQVQIQKIERILGIWDSALGKDTDTNKQSGVAIKALAKQSNLASYHYEFNFLEYVKQGGNVVLESMPNYLTLPQQMAFVDDDDKAVVQMINTPGGITFDTNEKYNLAVQVMPDSDTDREAEADALMEMANNQFLAPLILRAKGGGALIVKAQRGRYAQQLGALLEDSAIDPEKQEMQKTIQQLQQGGQAVQKQLEQLKADKSLEFLRERNRNNEAMRKLELDAAKDADTTEVNAYKAETDRQKVDMIPKAPESILAPDGGVKPEQLDTANANMDAIKDW